MVKKAQAAPAAHVAPARSASSSLADGSGLAHRSRARGLLDASNLPALQNLVKRDPPAYADEFAAQWHHYQSIRRIYAAEIGAADEGGAHVAAPRVAKDQEEHFCALLSFVTQLAPSYPQLTASYPGELAAFLLQHHERLGADVRRSAVRSLVLLRNREVISSEELLRTLFPLLSMTTSASLRSLIQTTILQDIKAQNRKSLNHRLNRVVQGLLFAVVERGMPSRDAPQPHAAHARGEIKSRSEALWAVRLAADLWRKNIWKDAKTVSLIALACFHPHPKVQSSAVRFFLGDLHHAENGESSDSDSEEEAAIPDVNKMQHARKVNKKTRGGDRKVRQAAAVARKRRREAQDGREEVAEGDGRANFAALYLLNDPQGFGERLFENLSKGDRKMGIELKVRVMQLLSRVMGAHKCCILSFYSYVVKYLNPHQVHITLILVSLAQSVHSQTPPDALQPVLRKLSDAFVHPGVGPEVVAAGINSIRETCRRQPWAMEKELLADLVGYRKSKDKGVGAAARGLLQLYREVNPALLARSERGKSGALSVAEGKAPKAFGEEDEGQVGIPGLALLEKHLEEHEGEEDEDPEEAERKAWAGWEEDSDDDSDSSGGWIDVSSDEGGDDAFDVEDSDEEKDKADENKDKRSIKERLAARRERRREQRRREKSGEATAELDDDEASQADSEEGGEGEQSEAAKVAESAAAAEQEFSKLATTRILTPADFAKMAELRLAAAEAAAAAGGRVGANAKREVESIKAARKRTQAAAAASADGVFLDEATILGPRKKRKADYEERMASIAEGREGREKFGSKKGKKQRGSTTNEEKSKRSKAFAMTSKSWSVRSKSKTSLAEKSRKLKAHHETQRKRRGMK